MYENQLEKAEDGLVYLRGLIHVPESLRTEIIEEHHANPMRGHVGADRTTELISRNYYFPNMRNLFATINHTRTLGGGHYTEFAVEDRRDGAGTASGDQLPADWWKY